MLMKVRLWMLLTGLSLGGVGAFVPGVLGNATAQAQRVIDVTPSVNSQTVSPDTSISGVFENEASASVKVSSVKIFLNGQDITSRSTITRNFFSYRPSAALRAGDYTVRLDYESTQGQLRSVSWDFAVRPQVTLAVNQVTHNAAEGLRPGATFLVTINGTQGGRASVLLVEDGRTVREIQAQESSAGVYTATLSVAANSNLREGVVVGRLESQGVVTYGVAGQPAIFSAQAQASTPMPSQPGTSTPTTGSGTSSTPVTPAPLTAPRVTSHQDGDRIKTRGFTLVGETSPNAEVNVVVTATTPILGGVVNIGGDRLINQVVQADAQGRFNVEVPSPALLQRDTRYTIELTAELQNETSKTTTLELRQR